MEFSEDGGWCQEEHTICTPGESSDHSIEHVGDEEEGIVLRGILHIIKKHSVGTLFLLDFNLPAILFIEEIHIF